MNNHHPIGRPHDYLAYLAVIPDCQRQGVGSGQLRHRPARVDAAGRTAYQAHPGHQ